MKQFEEQYLEVQDLLKFGDHNLVIKRIIDFSLDTGQPEFYNSTNTLLDWLDTGPDTAAVAERLGSALQELYAVLAAKQLAPREKILECYSVKKQYGHSSFALGPVNLSRHSGDIIGLVGENGNGKTTLLRLLSGELYATAGKVNYHFNHDGLYDLRTKLVYIPQRTDTWRGSMLENLLFTASCYGYPPEEIYPVTQLIIARLGLRQYRRHSWKHLSSGYKMRFELARMLLRKPKVLLIDEPLANLDILAQQTILEDFRAIAKSPFRPLGIVLSSQQLYEVEKTSDQVIFLKNGVQKNLHESASDNEQPGQLKPLVIEFESSWTQRMLNDALQAHGLLQLQFNGGTYIANFNGEVQVNDFLKVVIAHNIPLVYFRNISNSTRRFFVS